MDRYHNFELIVYYEPTIFNSIISDDMFILHYAYMYHDKDIVTMDDINNNDKYTIDDLGKPKIPHYHLLINYKNAKTFNACLSQFTIPSFNTRVKPMRDNQKQEKFEYLWHLNHPNKFQYNQELIVTDNANFWVNVNSGNNEKTINLINDIINKRPLRELMETYGRDFVINYNKYMTFANELVYIESGFDKSKQKNILVDSRTAEIVGEEIENIQIDILKGDLHR